MGSDGAEYSNCSPCLAEKRLVDKALCSNQRMLWVEKAPDSRPACLDGGMPGGEKALNSQFCCQYFERTGPDVHLRPSSSH